MRGKDSFTAGEAKAIRDLLEQLRRVDRLEQKGIRRRLRQGYGFWITDFDTSGAGFDVTDFDMLVANDRIEVGNCNTLPMIPPERTGDQSQSWQEALRTRYRPERIRVLFVGESPPAGGTFFYLGDSILYRAFREAFGNLEDFLVEFQKQGFFLDDLVPFPVNKMLQHERKRTRRAHIGSLSNRLRHYRPEAVVTVMKAIQADVTESIERAGLSFSHHAVPFPRREHRTRFVSEIRKLNLWRS